MGKSGGKRPAERYLEDPLIEDEGCGGSREEMEGEGPLETLEERLRPSHIESNSSQPIHGGIPVNRFKALL